MDYTFYTADVFTDKIFNGAQIAVFPHAEGLNEEQMQRIACELNLSETVFVFPPQTGTRRIRIFSPKGESDFGGHPIIATAHVLACTGEIKLTRKHTPLVLEQNLAPVQVNVTQEEGKPTLIQFTMQINPIVENFVPPEAELAEMLSIKVSDIEKRKFRPLMVSCGYPYLIVPIRSYGAVRSARFNFSAWSESCAPATSAQEIFLFTPKTPTRFSDFHGRLVGPNIAANEDPPIGSAMPALAGYLCWFEHIRFGTYTFAIDRGDEDHRQSLLNIEMDKHKSRPITLRVGGRAVMVIQGKMTVPEVNAFAF